ncbi:uncharacterized protein LOC113964920 [Neopelma chrysocephalum]|uniref:uncharacterized protein LOC113964920 n=1 Tax=Neopelma chrysocephalum TaxID=114329 RepID=UPI000FCCED27|nr:uncharacterized protein LOC113964920 [Neopelma chrysocephalum]
MPFFRAKSSTKNPLKEQNRDLCKSTLEKAIKKQVTNNKENQKTMHRTHVSSSQGQNTHKEAVLLGGSAAWPGGGSRPPAPSQAGSRLSAAALSPPTAFQNFPGLTATPWPPGRSARSQSPREVVPPWSRARCPAAPPGHRGLDPRPVTALPAAPFPAPPAPPGLSRDSGRERGRRAPLLGVALARGTGRDGQRRERGRVCSAGHRQLPRSAATRGAEARAGAPRPPLGAEDVAAPALPPSLRPSPAAPEAPPDPALRNAGRPLPHTEGPAGPEPRPGPVARRGSAATGSPGG